MRCIRCTSTGSPCASTGSARTSTGLSAIGSTGLGCSVAGIGIGGKGESDIKQAGQLLEVVALCDIDEERLGKRGEEFPAAKKYFSMPMFAWTASPSERSGRYVPGAHMK